MTAIALLPLTLPLTLHLSSSSLLSLALPLASARPRPLVRTSLGKVLGNALPTADEFLGIPYADAARFKPALERSRPFDKDPLGAHYFGPACLQTLTANTTYGVEHGCHVLNIWRPAASPTRLTSPRASLPVMLFIPGGSNDFGEAEPYNASLMAANHHALICSINYRVGPFGFLAFSEDVSEGQPTGNHALTDIQAALRFLRREARAFGGDPSRLTIWGQSSGGSLALIHSLIPSSSGLLEGILSQSGGAFASERLHDGVA